MSIYKPDYWILVLFESEDYGKTYKILASWNGGFTHGNSWKLSSGVESFELLENNVYESKQTTGSVYMLNPSSEHISVLIGEMFETFSDQIAGFGSLIQVNVKDVKSYLQDKNVKTRN